MLLTIGTIGISFSIRTLVGNYLLQKTDTQLINQAQLIFNSMDSLSSDTGDDGRSLMNTYYVEVRDSEYKARVPDRCPCSVTEWFRNQACRPTAASTASLLDSHSRHVRWCTSPQAAP